MSENDELRKLLGDMHSITIILCEQTHSCIGCHVWIDPHETCELRKAERRIYELGIYKNE